jgi:hypothetical protein
MKHFVKKKEERSLVTEFFEILNLKKEKKEKKEKSEIGITCVTSVIHQ